MAGGTVDLLGPAVELPGVDIFMTTRAPLRRRLEGNFPGTGFTAQPVTIQTRQRAMRAGKFEAGARVIESLYLVPSLDLVTALAQVLSRFQIRSEKLGEFTAVRILMALGTYQRSEPELPVGARRAALGPVTVQASHRRMRTFQFKPRGLMAGNAERGRLESPDGVAILALVFVRGGGKLPPVRIAVAVPTGF